MDVLRRALALLMDGQPLPARYKDHPLKGTVRVPRRAP